VALSAAVDAEPELVGAREAARRLGVHENTVRNYADAGILPVAKRLPGSRYRRFDARDVEDLRRRMTGGGDHED
jgi:excisionase family DNA binding protein